MTNAGGFDLYGHLAQQPNPGAVCPHCRGVGGVDVHPELGFVCKLCGAPRIPTGDAALLDEVTRNTLRKAEGLRKKRGLFRAVALVSIVGVLFGFLVALPVLFFSFFYAVLTVLFVSGPSLAVGLYTRARAAATGKEMIAAVDAAWGAAARDLFRAGTIKSAADFQKLTGCDAERAQHAFTLLSVDAEIGVSNVRIDAGPVVAQVPEDPRFAALEQAEKERAAELEAGLAEADREAKQRVP